MPCRVMTLVSPVFSGMVGLRSHRWEPRLGTCLICHLWCKYFPDRLVPDSLTPAHRDKPRPCWPSTSLVGQSSYSVVYPDPGEPGIGRADD